LIITFPPIEVGCVTFDDKGLFGRASAMTKIISIDFFGEADYLGKPKSI
jgi:hypothetical protein